MIRPGLKFYGAFYAESGKIVVQWNVRLSHVSALALVPVISI
jgi:hypothetical protein